MAKTGSKKRTEKYGQVLVNRPVRGSGAVGTGVAHCQYPRAQSCVCVQGGAETQQLHIVRNIFFGKLKTLREE